MREARFDGVPDTPFWRVLNFASRFIMLLAGIAALAAGLILVAIVAVVAISIAGRVLAPFGFTSIRGDYELVSAGVAVAAFLSFGWTQIQGGHAAVGLLVDRFPMRWGQAVTALAHLAVAIAGAFLCWRLADGAVDRAIYRETMQLSRLPLVWPYLAASAGAGILALAALRATVLAIVLPAHPLSETVSEAPK